MSRFLMSRLQSLEVYVPGEQPKDREYIKLNTNESPYPPAPAVIERINSGEVELLKLYPDPDGKVLKEKIAKLYGVEAKNVYLANGSDDILNFAFMAFAGDGVKAYFADITYGFYPVFADLNKVDYETIPLNEDFTMDIEKYKAKKGFIIITNPNAPTCLKIGLDKIEEVLQSNPDNVVLVDEAYVDFGGETAVPLTKKYPNLLVVQTFSKSRSMAGARLGFAIADEGLIEDLERIKFSTNPYNINRLTMAAGETTIDNNDYYMENCRKIMETRAWTVSELRKLGFTVADSYTNFVFAKSDAMDGGKLQAELKKKGIIVRHFSNEKIAAYNRITIGTPEEMNAFIEAVKEILEENR